MSDEDDMDMKLIWSDEDEKAIPPTQIVAPTRQISSSDGDDDELIYLFSAEIYF
jgi:hypothetical protein